MDDIWQATMCEWQCAHVTSALSDSTAWASDLTWFQHELSSGFNIGNKPAFAWQHATEHFCHYLTSATLPLRLCGLRRHRIIPPITELSPQNHTKQSRTLITQTMV